MRTRCSASRLLALLTAGAALTAGPASGQVSAGVQANWGSDTDFGLGARISVALDGVAVGFEAVGSFDYFFPSDDFGADLTYWEANANLVYRIDAAGELLTPYVGAGFAYTRFEASIRVLGAEASGNETSAGINLLAGLMFNLGGVTPFIEGKIEAWGGEQFVASAGVRF
ncbi:MAG: outer membrane beta-barrel protein [Gemmatimonadetes bacterium]|nr:outer membrane beta-barrel protein [Gemmatimonadota bacterium]